MAIRTLFLDERLYAYWLRHGLREPDVLRRLREATERIPGAAMRIAPEEGQFLALLVELTGAKLALEVGTFAGYSALWIATALAPDGRLTTCDVDAEAAAVAKRYWEEAGVAERIDFRLAPALSTLDALLAEGRGGTFDFAFVDADKENVGTYYERALALLRPGGLVAVDNAFWDGTVADPRARSESTRAIRALLDRAHRDTRVATSIVPVGDGILLARKRG